MAKIKTIGLTRYVSHLLLSAFFGVIVILLLTLLTFQVLISTEKIAPANAGETEARKEITRLKGSQTFPADLSPEFYQYVYFSKNGAVKSSSLSKKSLKKITKQYKDKEEPYSTAAYLTFSDGTYALFLWQYKAQFTNPRLRRLFPNFEVLFIIGISFALVLFFILFARRASKQLKGKLVLVEQASQQITQKNLETAIAASTGILEFDHVLQSMEEMRGALKESLVQQWETQQQRKQEIAALTHDINTPLTVINGNAELLLEEEWEDEQKQLITDIYESGLKTKEYIGLLQQISNFEVFQEEKTVVPMETILEEMSKTLLPLAKQKGLRFIIQNKEENLTIIAAPVMLTRALVNIGDNAIRHTEAGDVTIRIEQQKQELSFIFEDNGPGFSPAALTHAKEMFWQQDQSRTANTNYGIGLSIVERVAKDHHGRLELGNTEHGGKAALILSLTE
ncbi:sensor histidine kinase [Candidatus Enterococcus murrayae]|uniref:histidine kinase n=1 Tax=Candidatus Enterococcus murrayae TaxID=2815321 RepID=A0ABS3HHU4_9ENTE|nr:HAMP domain-containing sensor histidine kinase [Enterococcus sp. MJM16]MBO0453028.1 HAMP domain-containing histidine kinase [Enterococcus sp. MJM16]